MTPSPQRIAEEATGPRLAAAAPLLWRIGVALVAAGLTLGLAFAPADPVLGAAHRVVLLHYPAEALALGLYLALAALSVAALGRPSPRARFAAMLSSAVAPTGLLFAFLALWTESLWRRPVRGVWWSWDAETVAQLLLLFLYAGFIALKAMLDDPRRADRAGAVLALLGAANLPVLFASIAWWDAMRHPGAAEPAFVTPLPLLAGTLLVGLGLAAHAAHASARRFHCLAAEREILARSTSCLQEFPA